MKRTCLINILWVCYLFRPNTECKWLLTVPDSASRLGSGIVISFVCVCAASISSFLWPSLSSFLFLSVFCFLTVCESKLYSGARLRPQGFTSHTPRWQFIVPYTDNDLHFLSCLTWWPFACECVTRSNGIFYKTLLLFFFTQCRAQGNTRFACACLF